MRSSLRRLAEASANIPFSLSQASAQLIPPIPCVHLATTRHPHLASFTYNRFMHPLAHAPAHPISLLIHDLGCTAVFSASIGIYRTTCASWAIPTSSRNSD